MNKNIFIFKETMNSFTHLQERQNSLMTNHLSSLTLIIQSDYFTPPDLPKDSHCSDNQNSSQGSQSPGHLPASSPLCPPTNWVQPQEPIFLTFKHTRLVPTNRSAQGCFSSRPLPAIWNISSGTFFDPQLQGSPPHILCYVAWLILFTALPSLYNHIMLCLLLLGPWERRLVCLFPGVSISTWHLVGTQQFTAESTSTYQSRVLENATPDGNLIGKARLASKQSLAPHIWGK